MPVVVGNVHPAGQCSCSNIFANASETKNAEGFPRETVAQRERPAVPFAAAYETVGIDQISLAHQYQCHGDVCYRIVNSVHLALTRLKQVLFVTLERLNSAINVAVLLQLWHH